MSQDYPSQYPPASTTPRQVSVRTPQGKPLVTYTLLGLCVAIYALQWATQSFFGFDYPSALGLKVNELIIQGQLWRLFTPMFLHGSIVHIALNMYALLAFGPQLERYYGHGRYLALYLVSGFAGNVASFQFSSAPSLGASTAIFGLLGAEAVFLYRNRKLFGGSAQRALTNLIVIGVINLVYGFASPGIDYWGHIGGLVGGVLFAWFGGPVLEVSGSYSELEMVDTRESSTVILAGLGVFLLFAVLAGVKIFSAGGA
jgi:rhomboid protease GluP